MDPGCLLINEGVVVRVDPGPAFVEDRDVLSVDVEGVGIDEVAGMVDLVNQARFEIEGTVRMLCGCKTRCSGYPSRNPT